MARSDDRPEVSLQLRSSASSVEIPTTGGDNRLLHRVGDYFYIIKNTTPFDQISIHRGTAGTTATELNSGNRPTVSGLTNLINEIDSVLDPDGIIHVAFMMHASSGSVRGVHYVTFDTNTGLWGTDEQAASDTSMSISIRVNVSIEIDSNGKPHIAWGANGVKYVNKTTGSWSATETLSTTTASGIAIRQAGTILGLFAVQTVSGQSNLRAWYRTGIESASTWGSVAEIGLTTAAIERAFSVRASNQAWHLVGMDNTDGSISDNSIAYLEISASTTPSYYFERGVITPNDLTSPENVEISRPVIEVSADGEQVVVFALHTGSNGYYAISQRTRHARSVGFDPGPSYEVFGANSNLLTGAMTTPISDDSVAFLCINYVTGSTAGDWYVVTTSLSKPATAGISHDVVLGNTGFTLAGAMSKVDITASIPRVSIATEQKKHFDFSELDTFGQQTFHQGRGEKYLRNPQAFSDSDNVLTHIPNQVTLALQSYGTGAASDITPDSTSYSSGTNVSSLAWSHTCAGTNRILVVSVTTRTASVSSVTYMKSGVPTTAMTLVPSSAASSGFVKTVLYYMVAPDSGTYTITVTLGASDYVIGGGRSYTNVHQASPIGTAAIANGTTDTPTVSVTSAARETVLDVVGLMASINGPGADQTQQYGAAIAGSSATSTVAVSAVAVNYPDVAAAGAGNTVTQSFTTGASDNLILFAVHQNSTTATVAQVTWNGQTAVLLNTRTANGAIVSLYYLVGGAVAPSTTSTATAQFTGNDNATGLGIVSFSGVDISTPFASSRTDSFGTGNSYPVTVTTVPSNMIFSMVAAGYSALHGISTSTGATEHYERSVADNIPVGKIAAYTQAAASTGTSSTVTVTRPSAISTYALIITCVINAGTTAAAGSLVGAGSSESGANPTTMSWSTNPTSPNGWAISAVPIKPASSTAATDLNGDPAKFFVYNGNWYALIHGTAAADNKLLVWNNGTSTFDTVAAGLSTSSGDPKDAAVYGGDLWLAQGEAVNMRTYDVSAGAWEDGQQPANYLAVWDGKLWRADNLNEIYYSSDPDAAVPTWTLAAAISDADTLVTKLLVYQDTLFIFKEDGVYALERNGTNTYAQRVISDDMALRGSYNGRGALLDKGLLFWNRQQSVVRFDGAATLPMGPDRGGDTQGTNFVGLPETERGSFRAFTTDGAFIYAALNPESTAYPQIMVYNSIGWHSFWKGTTLGADCTSVAFLPARTASGVLSYPTIWFNEGETIRYIKLPRNSHNPLDDTTLEYVSGDDESAFLDLSWYDAGVPDIPKMFGAISLEQLPPTVADQSTFGVRLQFDELTAASGTWYLHNSVTGGWYGLPDQTSDVPVIHYPIGDINAGSLEEPVGLGGAALAHQLRPRIILRRGDAATSTPVLKSYLYRFISKPSPRYGWTVPIKCYDVVTTLDDREEENDAGELRRELYEMRESEIPVFFDDGTTGRAYRNSLRDPSFERELWTSVGTVTQTVFCAQHKKFGQQSQFIYTTSTSDSGVESPPISGLNSGQSILASAWILNQGPSIVSVQLMFNGTIAESGEVPPSKEWQEVVLSETVVLDSTVAKIRVIKPGSGISAGVHIDGAQLIIGADEHVSYTDGDRVRCYWEGTPADSSSMRRRGYVVYVVGLNEVFRYRKTNSEEGTPRYDSEITVQLREVI